MPRANLRIKVGSYTGTGAAMTVTGVGFRPHLVIVKKEGGNAVFRTREQAGDSTGFLTSLNAALAGRITAMASDGFSVGTQSQVNTAGTTYHYVAIRGDAGQKHFRTFRYWGNGADDRDLTGGGLGFTPDLVLLQGQGGATYQACHRTSAMPDGYSVTLDAFSAAADVIQSLIANGFQLGATAGANAAAVEHLGFAMKSLQGAFAVGSFVGTGAARSITGLGFSPDVVVVKNYSQADYARIFTRSMANIAANSMFISTSAADASGITSLDKDGFTVGSGHSVNGPNETMCWFALKSGNFNAPVTRTSA
jgi:hypothetical protein